MKKRSKVVLGLIIMMFFMLSITASAETKVEEDAVFKEAVYSVVKESDFKWATEYQEVEEFSIENVEATYAGDGVLITWDKNSHPECLGYILLRAEYDYESGKIMLDAEDAKYWIFDTEGPNEYIDQTVETKKVYCYLVAGLIGKDNTITGFTVPSEKSFSNLVPIIAEPEVKLCNLKSGVKVEWDEVDGADGYLVYRRTASGKWDYNKYYLIDDPAKLMYTNTSVTAGTGYYYLVTAFYIDPEDPDYIWESAYNNGKYIKRLSRPSVTVSNSYTSVKLTWGGIKGAKGYEIYRDGEHIDTVTEKTWYDRTVESGKKYTYTVKAYYAGSSGTKHYSCASLEDEIYFVPRAKISKLTKGTRKFTVKYEEIEGITGYEIRYSRYSSFKNSKTTRTTSLSKTVSSLTKGKKYYVKVRAYITVDGVRKYGKFSPVKSITVK